METQTNNQPSQQPSPAPSQQAGSNKTLMGVLSYLGFLVLIPLLTDAKRDPFIKFHIKQGLVVFSIEVIVWILASMVWRMWPVINILNIATLVLSIIGIVNVVQNREKELPLVGGFSKYFTF